MAEHGKELNEQVQTHVSVAHRLAARPVHHAEETKRDAGLARSSSHTGSSPTPASTGSPPS
jgi:hypothetical protein